MDYPIWGNEYPKLLSRFISSSSGDSYALLEDFYLQGGYRVCSSIEERNEIGYDKRKIGMMVHIRSGATSYSNTFWILINEPVPDPVPPYEYDPSVSTLTTDSDWNQLQFGASGMTFSAITYSTDTEVLTIKFRDSDGSVITGTTIIPFSSSGLSFSALTYENTTSTLQIEFKIGLVSITGETILTYVNTDPTTATNLEGFPVGTTFPNTGLTLHDMWSTLLYPTIPPPGAYFSVTPSSQAIPLIGGAVEFDITFINFTWPENYYVLGDSSWTTGNTSGVGDGSFYITGSTCIFEGSTYREQFIVVSASGITTPIVVKVYQAPSFPASFTSFSFDNPLEFEVGQTVATKTATWTSSPVENIIDNSIEISGPNLTTVTGLDKNTSQLLTFTNLSSSTIGEIGPWTITGYNILNNAFTRTFGNLSWSKRAYWGKSTNIHLTDPTLLSSSGLTDTCVGEYYFMEGSGFTYWFFDSNHGTPIYFKEKLFGFGVSMNPVYQVVTANPYGVSCTYNVYKSTYKTYGEIWILVF